MSVFLPRGVIRVFAFSSIFLGLSLAQVRQVVHKPPFAAGQYILLLTDPPVAERFSARDQVRSLAAEGYRQQVELRQRDLTRELASRNIKVTGSVSTLLNAIFVAAPADRMEELKTLP